MQKCMPYKNFIGKVRQENHELYKVERAGNQLDEK
jgi:hypothetical protein